MEKKIHRAIKEFWREVGLILGFNVKIEYNIDDFIKFVESKVNLKKTPITMFLSAIRLRLVHSPFNFMVRVYSILPAKLKFHRMF